MKIRLRKRVKSDLPAFIDDHVRSVEPGEYDASFNTHGAVSVETEDGSLGVKPDEYLVVSMTAEEMAQIKGQPMLAFAASVLQAQADSIPSGLTLIDLATEIRRARGKFPHNDRLMLALAEEVGELARDILEGKPYRQEALHVACVAVRIFEEGCAEVKR